MDDSDLILAAKLAREKAYAPYSKFAVGAALLGRSGRVFKGCNIENISFGLTICAEMVCVCSAVLEGEIDFEAIAITSSSSVPVIPCGACRQVLAEFTPDLRVICATMEGVQMEYSLSTLLPIPRQGILN